MSGWWVSDLFNSANGPVLLVSWVVWVIASIVLHELGHGYAALWQGDSTPRDLRRMNLNPLVHMGPTSLIVFALFGIAWGAMPVNPYNFRSRNGDAYVAAAGPAVNVGLFVLASVGLLVVTLLEPVLPGSKVLPANLRVFFFMGMVLNVALFVLNMLPVPPLDGSRILASFVPSYARLFQGEHAQWVGLGLFALIFFFGADLIFDTAFTVAGIVRGVIDSLVA